MRQSHRQHRKRRERDIVDMHENERALSSAYEDKKKPSSKQRRESAIINMITYKDETEPSSTSSKGGQGRLMSPPCPKSQGCHLIPHHHLFSCFSACFHCSVSCLHNVWNLRAVTWFLFTISSHVFLPIPIALSASFLPTGPFFWLLFFFYQKILRYFSSKGWRFGMALVQQLGDDGWSVISAACCHMALVYAIVRLYNIGIHHF